MKCEFNVPVGSGISLTAHADGTVTLFIKAPGRELEIEMDKETAAKIGSYLSSVVGGDKK